MKRLLRNVLAAFVVSTVGVITASAQASYNFSYTQGVTVAAGGDYFLYNIGKGQFLTGGMDWGSHASADHAGKVCTLAVKSPGYSIYTTYYSENGMSNPGYLATNEYTDGSDDATWVFTPVNVNGYTNAYTIKNGNDYLYYENSDTRVHIGANTDNNYSYWLIIPRSTREAAGDYTFYIQNTGINRFWERACWAGSSWGNTGFATGGNADNPCGEKFHGAFDFYQSLSTGVPAGRFRLWCQGFWRQDGGDAGPVFYANSDQVLLSPLTGSENSMNDASTSFSNGNYVNSVETFVSDGNTADNLRVGINITSGTQWVIWDNFVLQYLGQVVMDYADPLPSGNMTANKWYYFEITVPGQYTLSTTTLGNIKYTTDGYTLTSASPTNTWSSATQTLAAGRYYIKSSSAQGLTVEAASYTYNVGDATISRTCVQGGETVTVSYPDALTNSGEALTINTSGVTFNNAALTNAQATSNGFTFDIPTGLAAGSSFTLSIPAGAVGYANGNTYNTAATFTVTTPALFDGTYFLKVGATTTDMSTQATNTEAVGMYLARGNSWGTRATIDKYGLAIQVSTDANNYTLLKVFDTQRSYTTDNNNADIWADQGGNQFIITKSGSRLLISCKNAPSKYLKYNANDFADGEYPVFADGDANNNTVLLFEAETPEQHQTAMASLKNAQAATAAAAAYAGDAATYGSLQNVTTVAGIESAVASMYSRVITGGAAPTTVSEKYQGNQPNPAPETVYQGTLTIPAQGLYKFSMQAFYRAGWNDITQQMHTAGADMPPVVLFLGDSETQIMSLYDEQGGSTPYVSGNDAEYNGMYYANNMDASLMMFQEGKYHNEVWAFFPAAGTYNYGVKYMGYANANGQWFIYSPEAVTVTYYGVDDAYFNKLAGEIAKATAINSEYNNNALATEIATAQAMYTAYTANQTTVNNEVAALKALYPSTTVSVANGTFDTNPVFLADGSTASGATQTVSTNGALYVVSNYSNALSGGEWVYGANAEYGSSATLNGATPPTLDMFGESTGAALGLSAGWSHDVIYSQDVTVSQAGKYLVYYEAYNKNANASGINANKIGLDGTYSSKVSDFTADTWVTDVFTVDIYDSGTYTLTVGMYGEGASGGNAKLWIDNVEIYRIGDAAGRIETANGVVTVLGSNTLANINAALTSDIAVLNIEKAAGLSSASITTTNNPNLLIYAKASNQVNSSINNVIVGGTCARLRLSKQSSPFFVPTAFTATSAQYNVASGDLAGGEYATLMIPFAGGVPTGSAYTLDQGVNTLGGEVKATQVSTVPANSPVLITGYGNFTGSGVLVPAFEKDAPFTSGELTGVYSTTTAPQGSYVLQNHSGTNGVAFYLVGETQPSVGPFRAYIKPQSSNAKALRVIFINGDDTTGIGTLREDGTVTLDDAEYYTVGGARLSAPQKGLNVVKYSNGTVKKIFVK